MICFWYATTLPFSTKMLFKMMAFVLHILIYPGLLICLIWGLRKKQVEKFTMPILPKLNSKSNLINQIIFNHSVKLLEIRLLLHNMSVPSKGISVHCREGTIIFSLPSRCLAETPPHKKIQSNREKINNFSYIHSYLWEPRKNMRLKGHQNSWSLYPTLAKERDGGLWLQRGEDNSWEEGIFRKQKMPCHANKSLR